MRFLREKNGSLYERNRQHLGGSNTSTQQGNYKFLCDGIEEYISKIGRKSKVTNNCSFLAVTVLIRTELKDPALTNEWRGSQTTRRYTT